MTPDMPAKTAPTTLSELLLVAVKTAPTTLSELLLVAVDDAEQIEQDERYTLDMYKWHEPVFTTGGSRTCHVCMAGAIIARRLQANPTFTRAPFNYPYQWRQALFAVDAMRTGELVLAYRCLTECFLDDIPAGQASVLFRLRDTIQNAFDDDMGRAPWSVYRDVVKALQEAGL